jgi:hypothetical protein
MHYEFPDGATLLQGIRSAGPTILAERVVGVNAVKETILRAAAPYRTAEGGYRVELEWARSSWRRCNHAAVVDWAQTR